jgi:hypothetical protein
VGQLIGGVAYFVPVALVLKHLHPGLKSLDFVRSMALKNRDYLFNGLFFCFLAVAAPGKEQDRATISLPTKPLQ